ncbi:hypothetical protein BaRGS_00028843 [Batillaria attramentaria]|uniref:Uncharacterized protein n=1 Tax=Batillaria attramentaria TaxID=370345 RepID=A0ABD0JZD3_9CAEN
MYNKKQKSYTSPPQRWQRSQCLKRSYINRFLSAQCPEKNCAAKKTTQKELIFITSLMKTMGRFSVSSTLHVVTRKCITAGKTFQSSWVGSDYSPKWRKETVQKEVLYDGCVLYCCAVMSLSDCVLGRRRAIGLMRVKG